MPVVKIFVCLDLERKSSLINRLMNGFEPGEAGKTGKFRFSPARIYSLNPPTMFFNFSASPESSAALA